MEGKRAALHHEGGACPRSKVTKTRVSEGSQRTFLVTSSEDLNQATPEDALNFSVNIRQ